MKNWVQKTKRKKALFFFLNILISLIASLMVVSSCKYISYFEKEIVVNKIFDGDTFGSRNEKFRILGIDTPETYDAHNNFKPTSGSQFFYGNLAKIRAQKILLKKKILIESIKKDKYNRWVTKVTLNNGCDYGAYMIQNGLAVVRYISNNKKNPFYYYDNNYYNYLLKLQEIARKKKIGFWIESDLNFKNIFPSFDIITLQT